MFQEMARRAFAALTDDTIEFDLCNLERPGGGLVWARQGHEPIYVPAGTTPGYLARRGNPVVVLIHNRSDDGDRVATDAEIRDRLTLAGLALYLEPQPFQS